ncbi:MAG: hypothetical protein WBB82_09160 [Limnothrix sp.]
MLIYFVSDWTRSLKRHWRRSPVFFSCLLLLIACEPDTTENVVNNSAATAQNLKQAEAANCPTTDTEASRFDPNSGDYIEQLFDFTTQKISNTADTLVFHTNNHDLVFCRSDSTWAVLAPSEATPLYEEFNGADFEALSDPNFASIQADGQTYKYRSTLEPNPFPDYTAQPEKVIFEFIPAGETESISLDLYSAEQLRDSGLGNDLGVPEVQGAVQVEDQLFFAVSSEQGEGFSGLTTLLRYDIPTGKLAKIQPQNIIAEQIISMVATTEADKTTLWLGTKYSSEGSDSLPAKGLVTYTFTTDAWETGSMAAYSVENSPLVGAIPSQLYQDDEVLWVATGSGICQFPWQQVKQWEAWECWEFGLEAELDAAGVPIFSSTFASVPLTTLSASAENPKVEVLWWSNVIPISFETDVAREGRYEVVSPTGLNATVNQGGFFSPRQANQSSSPWDDRVYWPGEEWHWQGEFFERSFDEVDINLIALGARGISENGYELDGLQNTNAMRGRFELLSLTSDETRVKYFSGWVDDELLEPYFVVLPSDKQPIKTPDPIEAIAPNLPSF